MGAPCSSRSVRSRRAVRFSAACTRAGRLTLTSRIRISSGPVAPSAYSHPGATTMTSVPRGPRPANLARSRGISTVTQGSCPGGTLTLIAFSAETFASHPTRAAPLRGRRRGPTRRSRLGRYRLPQRCRRRRCRPPRSSCRRPLPPEPPDARPRRAARTCGDSGPRTCAVRNRYAMEVLGWLEDPEDRLPEAQSQGRQYG